MSKSNLDGVLEFKLDDNEDEVFIQNGGVSMFDDDDDLEDDDGKYV